MLSKDKLSQCGDELEEFIKTKSPLHLAVLQVGTN